PSGCPPSRVPPRYGASRRCCARPRAKTGGTPACTRPPASRWQGRATGRAPRATHRIRTHRWSSRPHLRVDRARVAPASVVSLHGPSGLRPAQAALNIPDVPLVLCETFLAEPSATRHGRRGAARTGGLPAHDRTSARSRRSALVTRIGVGAQIDRPPLVLRDARAH